MGLHRGYVHYVGISWGLYGDGTVLGETWPLGLRKLELHVRSVSGLGFSGLGFPLTLNPTPGLLCSSLLGLLWFLGK